MSLPTTSPVRRLRAQWPAPHSTPASTFGLLLTGERPGGWIAAGLMLVLASLWTVVRSPAPAVT